VKTLLLFLISSVSVFLPAAVAAQTKDCRFPTAQQILLMTGLGREGNEIIVKALEEGQNCLNENLSDNEAEILDLHDRLKQYELDLHTAETKTETLESKLADIEFRLSAAEHMIEILTSSPRTVPHPAGKPKAAASKPTASNPNAPAIKPKPTAEPTTPTNPQ
jgi:hypothetical protein